MEKSCPQREQAKNMTLPLVTITMWSIIHIHVIVEILWRVQEFVCLQYDLYLKDIGKPLAKISAYSFAMDNIV